MPVFPWLLRLLLRPSVRGFSRSGALLVPVASTHVIQRFLVRLRFGVFLGRRGAVFAGFHAGRRIFRPLDAGGSPLMGIGAAAASALTGVIIIASATSARTSVAAVAGEFLSRIIVAVRRCAGRWFPLNVVLHQKKK